MEVGEGERGEERTRGVSIKIKGSFLWKKYEILQVHFKGKDRVIFKAKSGIPFRVGKIL